MATEHESFELWEREFSSARRNEKQMMDWMEFGIKRGWVLPPLCINHDPVPLTLDEVESIVNDEPECVFYLRILQVPVLGGRD